MATRPTAPRLVLGVALLSTACVACTACRRGASEAGESTPPAAASGGPSGSAGVTAKAAGSGGAATGPGAEAAALDALLWAHAKDGDEEDLAALATHVGAAGLAAAGEDPERRATALLAAPRARGYAHVAWLATVASAAGDDDARLALAALGDLGARVRRAEEHEDEEELAEGCAKLAALAKDESRPRERRIAAVRAARTLPCPTVELPTTLDAR